MEQLNGLDSLLILSDFDNTPLHIGAIMLYEGENNAINPAKLEALLLDVIENTLPVFKSKVDINRFSLDNPYWVEDKAFDIHNHFTQQLLPKSAGWPELHQLAQEFHATALSQDKPLWEFMLVEGFEGIDGVKKGQALLLKIHHALADGKTAVNLFAALHALSPEDDAPLMNRGLGDNVPDFSAPNWLTKYTRAYWHTISSPLKMVRHVGQLSGKIRANRKEQDKQLPTPARTPFSIMPQADRVLGHIKLPFDEINRLTNNSVFTVNDVALTVIAGAMSEYLSATGEQPEIDLQTLIPIDIRDDEDTSIGNQISFAKMSLFSKIEDPQLRLQAVHEATTAFKKEHLRLGPRALLDFANSTYPGLLSRLSKLAVDKGLVEKSPPVTNTIISNVPGIPVPCYLCGVQLVDYVGLGFLVPGVSLFHVISSVHSHVNISFLSCAAALKEPELYTKALQNSYQALLTTATKTNV
ncbi:MAG: DUF1298 domain-containing protein [Pseudomonadales bacterium]|nr:DUF1298 domain-containing protein [Pseudomonadales bacterium]